METNRQEIEVIDVSEACDTCMKGCDTYNNATTNDDIDCLWKEQLLNDKVLVGEAARFAMTFFHVRALWARMWTNIEEKQTRCGQRQL